MKKHKKLNKISYKAPTWMVLETDDGKRQMKENVFDQALMAKVKGLGLGTHIFHYEQQARKDGQGLAWSIVDAEPINQPQTTTPVQAPAQAATPQPTPSQARPQANGQAKDLDPNVMFQNMSYIAQVAIKSTGEAVSKLAERGATTEELVDTAGKLAQVYMAQARAHLSGEAQAPASEDAALEEALREADNEATQEVSF